jgi:hypothetical protein
LHRFLGTGYSTEISDSVLASGSGWALTYEHEMLDSWIGFFIERANNVSDYYFNGIQAKGVG